MIKSLLNVCNRSLLASSPSPFKETQVALLQWEYVTMGVGVKVPFINADRFNWMAVLLSTFNMQF